VEQTSDFQQAEAIETAFVQAVEQTAAAGVETEATMLPVPTGEGEGEGRLLVASMEGVPEPVNEPLTPPPEESIEADSSRLERSSGEGGGPQEAIPISIPGVQMAAETPAAGIRMDHEPKPPPPPPDLGGIGSLDVTSDTSPEGMPQPVEEVGQDRTGMRPAEMVNEPLTPPPEESIQADGRRIERTSGEEGGPQEAIPISIPGVQMAPETGVEQIRPLGMETPMPGPDNLPPPEGSEGEKAPAGTTMEAEMPPEDLVDQMGAEILTEAMEGLEEVWIPPEMYVHVGSDGSTTVVGGDGKPMDSPPILTKYLDESGLEKYVAYYPASGKTTHFDVSVYQAPLNDLYVHYNQDGTYSVVSKDGKLVDSPPIVQKAIGPDGIEVFSAHYPVLGKNGVVEHAQLSVYSTSLEGNLFVHVAQDGTLTVVDEQGEPVASPPLIKKYLDTDGTGDKYAAYYPVPGQSTPVALPVYSAPIQGMLIHYNQDGTVTVVDEKGQAVKNPPLVNKVLDTDGTGDKFIAYYPTLSGDGTFKQVQLGVYSAPLGENLFVHTDSTGKLTVVDEKGQAIDSPPLVQKYIGSDGLERYAAYYPTPGGYQPTELPSFSIPLAGYYAHCSQDGQITVVDANGKPIACQPLISKIMNPTGTEVIVAWYPALGSGGASVALPWYKPPSAE
jgi:hypothetical protein